jgi:hypothetical protein
MPMATQPNTTPKRPRTRRRASVQDYSSLTFAPVKAELNAAGMSLSDWLARAQDEYLLFWLSVSVLEKDDVGLAAFVTEVGAEPALGFYKGLVELEKTYRAGAKVAESVHTRLLASLSRVYIPVEAGA